MGDRGNIVFHEDYGDGVIYFYTHWSGSELPNIVASALSRGENRWDDDIYLARILFSELIKNDVLDETGYGIYTKQGDGGTEVFVYASEKEVEYNGERLSFDSFVAKYS